MRAPGTILVVGAGLAGARCAETLRAEGFDGRVVVVGEEPLPPYERPALSKELLTGARPEGSVWLRPDRHWPEQGIELLLGTRIARVDVSSRTAIGEDGRTLAWDALVLATGARARTLPDLPAGVRTLRTLADALVLREELRPGRRLAVVGAGLVGGEVASSAASLGVEVTVVDRNRAPLERALGREAGLLLAERYAAYGIELRLGSGLAGFRTGRAGIVRGLVLEDGSHLRCDAVLLGIGAEPVAPTGVAAALGGIPTDACGRTALRGVYACGDAALWWRPRLGRSLRVEHWTSAAAQGAAVARTILGDGEPHDEPPYFWSDQLGLRLQCVGHPATWKRVEIDGDPDSFSVRYLDAEGRLLAALLANRPQEASTLRRELAA